MKILIFIPARGGSKGIPWKNLVELNGKPLIQYTLETTQELMGNTKYFSWNFGLLMGRHEQSTIFSIKS